MPGVTTAVGLALSDGLPELLATDPELADYLEVPFERLAHSPELLGELPVPAILHCASLSLAGNLPPHGRVVEQLRAAVIQSGTPWLGEHLAFVSMVQGVGQSLGHEPFAPPVDEPGARQVGPSETGGGIYNVGYTVSPQYSDEILARVSEALDRWEAALGCPLIIENGPVYFDVPGSTMSQGEFIGRLCMHRPQTRLLLDLAHLACTAENTGVDAEALLESLPLERVVEVHLSGYDASGGRVWDDHAVPIPSRVFSLLNRLLRRVRPRAVTIEYNWDPHFPLETVRRDLDRVRGATSRSAISA